MSVSLNVKCYMEDETSIVGRRYFSIRIVVTAVTDGGTSGTNVPLNVTYRYLNNTMAAGSDNETISFGSDTSTIIYNKIKSYNLSGTDLTNVINGYLPLIKVDAKLSGSSSASSTVSYTYKQIFRYANTNSTVLDKYYPLETGTSVEFYITKESLSMSGYAHDDTLTYDILAVDSTGTFDSVTLAENCKANSVPQEHEFTADEFISWLSPSSDSITFTICKVVKHENGTTLTSILGGSYTLYLDATIKPSISSVTPVDDNGYRIEFGVYIMTKSSLSVSCSALGIYGSTISKITYVMDGVTKIATTPEASVSFGALNQTGSRILTTTVTDSRGRTAVKNTTITVVAYVPPTLNFQAMRWDTESGQENDGSTTVRLVAEGSIPYVNDKIVTGAITFQGRQKNSPSWTTINTIDVSGTYNEIVTVANQSADNIYEYQTVLVDYFGTSILSSSSVGTATPILDFDSGGKGIGIGTVAPEEGLDIGMQLHIKGSAEDSFSRIQISDPDGVNSNILVNLGGDTLRLLTKVLGVDRAFVGSNIFMDNNLAIGGVTTSGGQTPILRLNSSNQVELTWTSGGLKGRVMKQLWSGTLNVNGSITVSELSYYNVFAVKIARFSFPLLGMISTGRGELNAGAVYASGTQTLIGVANILVTNGTKLNLRACGTNYIGDGHDYAGSHVIAIYGLL